jgi:hypothetical protein
MEQNKEEEENIIYVSLQPAVLGEALEDLFHKHDVIPHHKKIEAVNMVTLGTDEHGLIPIIAQLRDDRMLN